MRVMQAAFVAVVLSVGLAVSLRPLMVLPSDAISNFKNTNWCK